MEAKIYRKISIHSYAFIFYAFSRHHLLIKNFQIFIYLCVIYVMLLLLYTVLVYCTVQTRNTCKYAHIISKFRNEAFINRSKLFSSTCSRASTPVTLQYNLTPHRHQLTFYTFSKNIYIYIYILVCVLKVFIL